MRIWFWCIALFFMSSAYAAQLTVFAASSLTDVFTELGKAFKAKTGHAIRFQFAGSQLLSTQLLHGAKADLYASADWVQYKRLEKSRLILKGQNLTTNTLAIITPKSSDKVKTLKDLTKPNLNIVVADQYVPVGRYTKRMLRALEQSQKGFTKQFLSNVVSQESNVRQVVLKIQLGEADAAVVYQSDITPLLSKTIRVIQIPKKYNQKASYPMGILKQSQQKTKAKAFMTFVYSAQGQKILQKWGFGQKL